MRIVGKAIITAVAFLAGVAVFAQDGSGALPFVRTDFGPVLTGSAGAAVASPEAGPWSAFRGAGALAFDQSVLNAGGEFRINGDGNIGLGAAVGAKLSDRIGAGLGVAYLGGDEIGGFRTSDMLIAGGVGFGITDNLSIGLNLRYAKQNLTESVSYKAASADIGALVKFTDSVTAAAGLSALGGSITSASGTTYKQPSNAYVGAEYVMGALSLDAMGEFYFSGSVAAALGAAYTYNDMVTIRAGYRAASSGCVLPSHFAAGIEGRFGEFRANVNIAILPATYIVSAGLGYIF